MQFTSVWRGTLFACSLLQFDVVTCLHAVYFSLTWSPCLHAVYFSLTWSPVCMQFTSVWRGITLFTYSLLRFDVVPCLHAVYFSLVWSPVYMQFTLVWRGPLFTCSLLQPDVIPCLRAVYFSLTWSPCLLIPINVKKRLNGLGQIFWGPAHDPREVYFWSKSKNFTPKIMSTFINFERHQFEAVYS